MLRFARRARAAVGAARPRASGVDADDGVEAAVGDPGRPVGTHDHAVRRRARPQRDAPDAPGARVEPAQLPGVLGGEPDRAARSRRHVVRVRAGDDGELASVVRGRRAGGAARPAAVAAWAVVVSRLRAPSDPEPQAPSAATAASASPRSHRPGTPSRIVPGRWIGSAAGHGRSRQLTAGAEPDLASPPSQHEDRGAARNALRVPLPPTRGVTSAAMACARPSRHQQNGAPQRLPDGV